MRFWFWPARVPCLRRRVLVNLVDDGDKAITGVLFDQCGDWLVLKDASMVQAKGQPVPLDGDVVIECRRVDFIQAFGS